MPGISIFGILPIPVPVRLHALSYDRVQIAVFLDTRREGRFLFFVQGPNAGNHELNSLQRDVAQLQKVFESEQLPRISQGRMRARFRYTWRKVGLRRQGR